MTRQDGSLTTEVVLVTPILLLLLAFVVMAGRLGEVRGAVVDAAQQAARAASLRGDASSARADAEAAAAANLRQLGVVCAEFTVEVETSRFQRGGEVGATVGCTVDLSDVAFAGLAGSRTFSSRAVEVIDVFRGGT
ncbi:MAG: pilus assembly protein [Actinomycetota bacterium]|nr:pilus assembly protein [Actinomycetota bacterium]